MRLPNLTTALSPVKAVGYVLVAGVILAGCGGDSSDSKASAKGGDASSEAQKPDGSGERPYEVTVNDKDGWFELREPDVEDGKSTFVMVTNPENVDLKELEIESEPENVAVAVGCESATFVESSLNGDEMCGENSNTGSADYSDLQQIAEDSDFGPYPLKLKAGGTMSMVVYASVEEGEQLPKKVRARFVAEG